MENEEDIDDFFDFSFSEDLDILSNNKKNNSKSIECEIPEIGTKYEKEKENIQFIPFLNMNKGNNIVINCKHYLTYYLNDIHNIYIYKCSDEEKIKIRINNKSIVQILYSEDINKIKLFIFLETCPKVYTKTNENTSFPFFFEKFKNKIDNYTYDNFYRNIDKNNPEKYFNVKHDKKLNTLDNKELVKHDKYERDVSYFSMDDEFLNLYLNDLIIKVSFENNYDNYELFQSIKQNMKEMKIKIKDNKNLDEIIKTIDTQEQYYFKEILINKSYIFYEY